MKKAFKEENNFLKVAELRISLDVSVIKQERERGNPNRTELPKGSMIILTKV